MRRGSQSLPRQFMEVSFVIHIKYMTKRLLPLLLFVFVMTSTAFGDVIPTPEWVHFRSANTTLNGSPIPVGALVDAFDPAGVHCGRYVVKTEGSYGLLNVYQDDDYTPGVDEGADQNDIIELRICGVVASTNGPDAPVWTSTYDIWEVDLSASAIFAFSLDEPLDGVASAGSYADYTFTIENTGQAIDFYQTSVAGFGSWDFDIIQGSPTGYLNPGESADVIVRVTTDPGALDGEFQDFQLSIQSAMDATVSETSRLVRTTVVITSAGEFDPFVPGVFKLYQNYPNPFNPVTRIDFSLERGGNVSLEVYNVIGQKIKTLLNGYYASGEYEIHWDGTTDNGEKVSSGIYFYRLTSDEYSRTRKMIMMK